MTRPTTTVPVIAPPALAGYDSALLGPLFAVSDEGSAARAVLDAAYKSAKAKGLPGIDQVTLGVLLDGERMTSAGEVPIGPDEYAELTAVAAGRLPLTTNVGVRSNARLSQRFPELDLTDGKAGRAWFDKLYAAFEPFVRTPDSRPRPLTVRLVVRPTVSPAALTSIVRTVNDARTEGKIGPSDLHRVSLLTIFPDEIASRGQIKKIEQLIDTAAAAGIPEVAIDGELVEAARHRLGVQSLLNILDAAQVRHLLQYARGRKVELAYRYQLDVETIARTIWTGLHTARTHGFAAGKYGLVPMTFSEQRTAIGLIQQWTKDWLAIPAFYVDTPLVTDDDVYDVSRCAEAAGVWLTMARAAGARIVLFDSPDRVSPRKLLRQSGAKDDPGVLTLAEVDGLLDRARDLGVSILWSGGITGPQAFELARRGVHGIFSTSSTARKMAVSTPFKGERRLAAESEPTEAGVRRIHSIVQGGFLSRALPADQKKLADSIDTLTRKVLETEGDEAAGVRAQQALDEALERGWRERLAARSVPVPADAVRVFRGTRAASMNDDTKFLRTLGTVFMPMTVQMQRLYGLTAYLPAVLPLSHDRTLPDEIALVFYRTQEAYHHAKQCVGGRAYSDLHKLVFDMDASPSEFPELFAGTLAADKAYHLFPGQVDWQRGAVQLFVGTRNRDLTPARFEAALRQIIAAMQAAPGPIDAAIVCATADWVICWAHAPGEQLPPLQSFAAAATPVMSGPPRREVLPPDLSQPYAGLELSPAGDALTMQFLRV